MGHEVRCCAYRVVTPENNKLAMHHVIVRLAPAFAERCLHSVLGRRAANAALQLTGAEPAPEARARHRHLQHAERAAVAVRKYCFSTMLRNDFLPPPGNFGDRLRPTDPLPFPCTFGTDAVQRMKQAVRMIDMVKIGTDLGAKPALGDGVVGITTKADGAAVLNFRDYTAGVRAIVRADPAD